MVGGMRSLGYTAGEAVELAAEAAKTRKEEE